MNMMSMNDLTFLEVPPASNPKFTFYIIPKIFKLI